MMDLGYNSDFISCQSRKVVSSLRVPELQLIRVPAIFDL